MIIRRTKKIGREKTKRNKRKMRSIRVTAQIKHSPLRHKITKQNLKKS